nr:hypothetical protein [Tanacetum cinerariifolium]
GKSLKSYWNGKYIAKVHICYLKSSPPNPAAAAGHQSAAAGDHSDHRWRFFRQDFLTNPKLSPRSPIYPNHQHRRNTLTMAATAASPPPWQQPLPTADTTNTGTTTPQIYLNHHLHHHLRHQLTPAITVDPHCHQPSLPPPLTPATTADTTSTTAASPAAAAAVAGCGRQKGRHRHGGAYKTSEFLFIFSMHGGLHRPYYGIFNLVVVLS